MPWLALRLRTLVELLRGSAQSGAAGGRALQFPIAGMFAASAPADRNGTLDFRYADREKFVAVTFPGMIDTGEVDVESCSQFHLLVRKRTVGPLLKIVDRMSNGGGACRKTVITATCPVRSH